MPAVRLNLEHNELIELCTYDNRRLSMRCTKHADGEPAVDLLPRVRYLLRVQQPTPREHIACAGSLFFTHGLVVVPEDGSDGLVRRVAVMNLSEKAVRVCNGREVAGDDWAQSPVRSASSSDAGSPRLPMTRGFCDGAAPEGEVGGAAFYMEYATLPPPRTAS
jgi:hypothetical protein